jgi:hypothetical protein
MLEGSTLKLILRELEFGACSMVELVEAVKVSRRAVMQNVRFARDSKLIYIAEWSRTEGRPVPLYKLGSRKGAEKPQPLGNTLRVRGYRQRNRIRYNLERRQKRITKKFLKERK